MVIPENKGSKYYEKLYKCNVLNCLLLITSFDLLMVVPENKGGKYYLRLSVMYCIVYFSLYLLIC